MVKYKSKKKRTRKKYRKSYGGQPKKKSSSLFNKWYQEKDNIDIIKKKHGKENKPVINTNYIPIQMKKKIMEKNLKIGQKIAKLDKNLPPYPTKLPPLLPFDPNRKYLVAKTMKKFKKKDDKKSKKGGKKKKRGTYKKRRGGKLKNPITSVKKWYKKRKSNKEKKRKLKEIEESVKEDWEEKYLTNRNQNENGEWESFDSWANNQKIEKQPGEKQLYVIDVINNTVKKMYENDNGIDIAKPVDIDDIFNKAIKGDYGSEKIIMESGKIGGRKSRKKRRKTRKNKKRR